MIKKLWLTAALAAIAMTTTAQAQTYQWQDELCDMQGDFDHKKYSAKQIKNSHLVLKGLTSANLNSFFPPMNIDALDKLSMTDLDTLTAEYQQVKRQVERLEVVPEAKRHKQDLLKSIDGEYQQNKLTILGYINPSAALKQSPKVCQQYIKPLLQNEAAVQNKWQQLVKKRAQTNSHAMARYQKEKASNPAKYAKIDLVTFGFGNCVNDQVYHADPQQVFNDSQKLNKTLFGQSLTMVCDEP
ncbi:hypothetical protein J3492_05065 [Psychrobacter sp. F1192]|uniref:DUF1311 domain-containing protein n=1 Tax=Psychrobacter coccoides TaxID=2818440 RepID=A0ABS3NMZ3_9GAMM|nr:hypothetical protein [Psychrobacter coccoides]MBO1530581.1 hypothetical protein [Psychrobacter coccoides]